MEHDFQSVEAPSPDLLSPYLKKEDSLGNSEAGSNGTVLHEPSGPSTKIVVSGIIQL